MKVQKPTQNKNEDKSQRDIMCGLVRSNTCSIADINRQAIMPEAYTIASWRSSNPASGGSNVTPDSSYGQVIDICTLVKRPPNSAMNNPCPTTSWMTSDTSLEMNPRAMNDVAKYNLIAF